MQTTELTKMSKRSVARSQQVVIDSLPLKKLKTNKKPLRISACSYMKELLKLHHEPLSL